MKYREERDTMGPVLVPEEVYWGPQTQRAVENFPVSGMRLPKPFNRALAMIKKYSADVNAELGLLTPALAEPITRAAQEVIDGKFDDQFVVDVFQTGSGTSSNMNMNEVIATRANEMISGKKAGKHPVHPNDHVNLGQSSNDVVPSAIHIAALDLIENDLILALSGLHTALMEKSKTFEEVKKIGRTHLQDAVPIFLGQEFSGYARQIELGITRVQSVKERLGELALGGTAVGTGLNTHPDFARRVISKISFEMQLPLRKAINHFEAQAAQDAAVETSGVLKTVAVSLTKIANDIRWLASGPRCGIGELSIPSLQPGSSIMPGKVNPVIPEVVLQTAAQVIGNDTAITIGGQGGHFELNTMLPVIAHNLLQSITLIASSARIFCEKCIRGILADRARCASSVEKSLALTTSLVPYIGYDKAAGIAKTAFETGRTVLEVAREEAILPDEELKRLLT